MGGGSRRYMAPKWNTLSAFISDWKLVLKKMRINKESVNKDFVWWDSETSDKLQKNLTIFFFYPQMINLNYSHISCPPSLFFLPHFVWKGDMIYAFVFNSYKQDASTPPTANFLIQEWNNKPEIPVVITSFGKFSFW